MKRPPLEYLFRCVTLEYVLLVLIAIGLLLLAMS